MIRLLTQTGYLVLILLVFQLLGRTNEGDLSGIALYALPLYIVTCFTVRQL